MGHEAVKKVIKMQLPESTVLALNFKPMVPCNALVSKVSFEQKIFGHIPVEDLFCQTNSSRSEIILSYYFYRTNYIYSHTSQIKTQLFTKTQNIARPRY